MKPNNHTCKRIVVKVGTSVLTGGTRNLSLPHMVELVRQCAELHHHGHEVIICTSGAVAVGRARLGFPELPATVANKQMLAAVGQSRLMLTWERFFEIYSIHIGQILLTYGDVESRHRFLNAQDSLNTLLEHHIIPVINENDAVATDEIKIGDNDNLAALTAILWSADLLILFTDVDGVYDKNPKDHKDARLIEEVADLKALRSSISIGSTNSFGTGGMTTKLEAAEKVTAYGIPMLLANGSSPRALESLAKGTRSGTVFLAGE